jgi:hypothetical protein
MYASPNSWWARGHLERLVTLATALKGNVSVLRVRVNENGSGAEVSPVGEPESVPLGRVNPTWMDVAFTGQPIGCDQNGGTCDEMERSWAFREVQKRSEKGLYKWVSCEAFCLTRVG